MVSDEIVQAHGTRVYARAIESADSLDCEGVMLSLSVFISLAGNSSDAAVKSGHLEGEIEWHFSHAENTTSTTTLSIGGDRGTTGNNTESTYNQSQTPDADNNNVHGAAPADGTPKDGSAPNDVTPQDGTYKDSKDSDKNGHDKKDDKKDDNKGGTKDAFFGSPSANGSGH